MRIIAGQAKGRRLAAPGERSGKTIRPTADRAREALFSILGWDLMREAAVLDLFAGTGALGLEALSRGANKAVFVDNNPLAIDLILQNITICGFADRSHVAHHNLMKGLAFWT
ncbi:MAG: RsmD family RNA methyltransferase, partial [Desulfobulbaceae bacterium]|nr:RsmD family RNA methyltransferase [Desulfobulbaceae bacterium]